MTTYQARISEVTGTASGEPLALQSTSTDFVTGTWQGSLTNFSISRHRAHISTGLFELLLAEGNSRYSEIWSSLAQR